MAIPLKPTEPKPLIRIPSACKKLSWFFMAGLNSQPQLTASVQIGHFV
jgi:hypothetical protein